MSYLKVTRPVQRLLRAVALLVGVSLLAACADPGRAPVPAGPPPVEVSLWHAPRGAYVHGALVALAGEYSREHPGVRVTVEAYEGEAYKTRIKTATAGGNLPDIFEVYGGGNFIRPMVEAGRLADLSPLYWDSDYRSHFNVSALDAYRFNGKLYGVPREKAVAVVWYNKELFAAHGLTPPSNMGEFARIVGVFARSGVTPVAVAGRERWPVALWYWYLVDRIGGPSPFVRFVAGQEPFTGPAFVQAGHLLSSLFPTGAFPVGFLGVDYARAERQFVTGQAAMYLMGSWAAGNLAPLGDRVGWFPFPAVTGGQGEPRRLLGHPAHAGYAVSTDSRHKDIAVDFVRWLTSGTRISRFVSMGRFLPAANLNLDELGVPYLLRQLNRVAGADQEIQVWWDQALPADLVDMHLDAIVTMAGGLDVPEQATAAVQAKVKE